MSRPEKAILPNEMTRFAQPALGDRNVPSPLGRGSAEGRGEGQQPTATFRPTHDPRLP
jgi:hypothetical protein